MKQFLEKGTLLSKQQITPHTWHLRIQLAASKPLSYTPGQHIRVFIGYGHATAFRDMVRTYSIWHYAPNQQIIDIAVCTFSEGPGAQWVRSVNVGQDIYFRGPEGKFTVDTSADFYILIGDTSSFAHFYELNRNLPGKMVHAILYAQDTDDHFPDLDGQYPLPLTTLPQNPAPQLIQSIENILKATTGEGIVYLGGDGRTCVTLNRHLRQRGWGNRQIKTKPFWTPGKKGLE